MQRRSLALCDFLLSGDASCLEAAASVDSRLLDHAKPGIFDSGDERNVLLIARKSFAQLCAALANQGFPRAAEMTLFDFHSSVE